MPILAPSPENVARAASRLREGGLVAFPTETVYGLGADATSAEAAARIFEAKRRPRFDPLIVHVASPDALPDVASEVPERALALAREFWPGPLTLVLRRGPRIPDLVAAELPTVAVRVPAHPVAQALLAAAGVPIAAPSANPFGYLSPTTARHVEEQLRDHVELILDGGPSAFGVESTIVDLSGPVPALLRAGALERERIEAVTGPLERR
ncbi:MAG: threonylcarbamoyl-AMP synthase, partial [Deltaproteobacteria bacterium]|nr:threonylcarbamoyl-AMP synthase [Deltaproteobacteria bacterium]